MLVSEYLLAFSCVLLGLVDHFLSIKHLHEKEAAESKHIKSIQGYLL